MDDPRTDDVAAANLRLEREKLETELRDLRRPYLLRNPQILTALIASLGAIIGVFLLISDNYYKILNERNNLQAQQTASLKAEAVKAGADADLAIWRAREETAKGQRAAEEARRVQGEAATAKAAAAQEVEAATLRAKSATARAADLEADVESRELVEKSVEAERSQNADDARTYALLAWKRKHSPKARNAIVGAFSHPIALVRPSLDDGKTDYGIGKGVFSPDGNRIVSSDPLRLWDGRTGRYLLEEEQSPDYRGPYWSVGFSRDSRYVVTGGYDGSVRVWDASTLKPIEGSFRNPSHSPVVSVSFSPDDKLILLVDQDGSAWTWSTESGASYRLEETKEPKEVPRNVKQIGFFSRDGGRVLTATGADGVPHVWNVARRSRESTLADEGGGIVLAAALSEDGHQALTVTVGGMFRVFDLPSGHVMNRFTTRLQLDGAWYSPDASIVVTSGLMPMVPAGTLGVTVLVGTYQVLSQSAFSGSVLSQLQERRVINEVTFSPDGNRILTTPKQAGDEIAVLSARGEFLTSLRAAERDMHVPAFSPDGTRVLVGGLPGTLFRIVAPQDVDRLFR